MYRLGSPDAGSGWPFLFEGHAFLADGTPLTTSDENGRIVPSAPVLGRIEKDCSGGNLRLADRWAGIVALAQALDNDDRVRAPILLLQLQIDERSGLAKYNHFHKPPGPGAGQFDSGPSAGGRLKPVEWSMHVAVNSDYQTGIYGEDVDKMHAFVMNVVHLATLAVGSPTFQPGMPSYGKALHDEVATIINALGDPDLVANPIYNGDDLPTGGRIPTGASLPDIVYKSSSGRLVVWEIKTGRATNTQDPGNIEQKNRTLKNMPSDTLYNYIQISPRQ